MNRPFFGILCLALLGAASSAQAGRVKFNRDIRPILSDNCFHCHGPDKGTRDSGLRLDLREEAIKPAKSGEIAIVPGDLEKSELLLRVLSDDKDEIMPPPKAHKKLTAEQKDLLKRWITEGAEYEVHWAYTPLVRPESAAGSGVGAIDGFIQAPLAARKIAPAPEADRRTLIRRLSLDLVGLPPTPADVEAFADDTAPDAYSRLVERLLASPQYGERMAQQWLDLARYADTVGFHGDQNQNVWAYRDWVIKAFNSNKRFDEFTIEQMAGDLLPNPTPEQLTATCFNRLTMMTREGGAQPKEYLTKYTADRVRTVGTAWLGSTFGCAECHDHKFDPITQKDFYALGAFFADIKQWGVYADYAYTPNPELRGVNNDYPFPPEITVESEALQRRIGRLQTEIAEAARSAVTTPDRLAAWRKEIGEFLQKHASGWVAPDGKVSARVPKAEATRKGDGSVTVALGATREITLDLELAQRTIAALKLELLPAEGGKAINRSGTSELIKVTTEVVGKNGTTREIEARHAAADHFAPRYKSGFATIGVQAGWKLDDLSKSHTAVFFLDPPLHLAEGETLQVRLGENTLARVRASVSPLAPMDVETGAFPRDLARELSDDAHALAYYVRSTMDVPETLRRIKGLEAELLTYRGGKTPVLVTEQTKKPLQVRVLPRGNWQDESGELCQPETAHFLPKTPGADGRALSRLDLARWLVSAENPLTPRVVMNRLWRQFFGHGLSAQTDDLGAQGEPPTHPELLDWLAAEFRESGWDTKRMVRLLVHSHTYKQAAGLRPEVREFDPQNRLLSAQNPRRLEAEFVRDNALAIAGLLNLEMGGPASRPYQPEGYYSDLQFPNRDYVASAGADQWRRGVYMHWQRTFLHPMLANFDAPSREDCIAMRTLANTPQQALTLLNDPTFVEAARVWAAALLEQPGDDGTRIEAAFQRALSRAPRVQEKQQLLGALTKARSEFASRPDDAEKLVQIGDAPQTKNHPPLELAAWTTVCRILLNLHETLTRF